MFVVNAPEFFLSHRLPLAVAARNSGFTVHVATGHGPACDQIVELGFTHHMLPLSRSGRNPLFELGTLWAFFRLMRSVRPDLIHLVTIKPVLYGGLMARLAGVPAVVAAISGLGTVFIARGGTAGWLRRGIQSMYRLALGHRNLKAIFQNPDDRAVFIRFGAVSDEQAVLIRGSGVALGDYPVCPESDNSIPVVTFAARLLKDKGVEEFVEAVRILKGRGVSGRFWLAGSPDPRNLSSVTEAAIKRWEAEGLVELLGYRQDIAVVFSQSNLVVLPSYREGLPKVLVEAAACGRAVVTTDVPGCRDAIEPGQTGLLVPLQNAVALADAIQSLIEDPEQRRRMGTAGRALAEQEFAIEKVVEAHLGLYRELLLAKGKH